MGTDLDRLRAILALVAESQLVPSRVRVGDLEVEFSPSSSASAATVGAHPTEQPSPEERHTRERLDYEYETYGAAAGELPEFDPDEYAARAGSLG